MGCALLHKKYHALSCSSRQKYLYLHRLRKLELTTMRTMRILFLHLIIFIVGVTFTNCTSQKGTYKIGVSQCAPGPWRDKVNHEMLAAQHLFEYDAKVIIATSYDDTQHQIKQIDSLVNSGIDLLVVAPNEAGPISDAIEKVKAKGIPVICFDRKVENDNYTAFIGGDNVEAGKAIGVNAIDIAHGLQVDGRKPFILEITAALSNTPALERHQGFAKVMEGHDELEYVWKESNWSSEETCRILKEQIGTGHLPDIVFCHNDGMATGAYKAVVETGTEGKIKIMGIDGMPGEGLDYVQFGHQIASYVYPTGGDKIIKLALDILTGKPYERENKLQGILVVPENAWPIATTTTELLRQVEELVTIQDKLEGYFGLYNTQRKVLVGSLVAIVLLVVAIILIWRALVQTRRTTRQRQTMNEEQILFYTNPDTRTLRQVFDTPSDQVPQPRSQDAIFAETLNKAIRDNMSNPELKMDDLGDELGMSRVQLYRKVKALTGISPVELLREMRLQRGYNLLLSTTKSVSEIAFEVGFNTPSYFSNCFKKQFGKYPTDLRAEQ